MWLSGNYPEPMGLTGLAHKFAGGGGGAAVGGAVAHDPEHPAGTGVRFTGHDLLHQPGERGDPGGVLVQEDGPLVTPVPRPGPTSPPHVGAAMAFECFCGGGQSPVRAS
jgi:hypothetical protein